MRATLEFLRLVLIMMTGRRYYLLPVLPLIWTAIQAVLVFVNDARLSPSDVQGPLIGVPLAALGVFLGVRIVAAEIDERSIEIAYTVPGGAERLWWWKLGAAGGILIIAETLLAATAIAFTTYPIGALYGALQSGVMGLVLAMGFSTLFRNEIAGAIATTAVFTLIGMISGFGEDQVRISPFWNPYVLNETSAAEVFAWTLQNRVGMLLAMASIVSLTFMRANRRERMLGN